MEPLISVLIPVYGVEDYIEQCLRSLFENTIAEKCEFVIVNDCTKDNSMKISEKIIEDYDRINVKIINHQKNSGLATTRNTGLKNASGKYIICTDSDDWVEKDYLEKLYVAAEEKQADITICNFCMEKDNETLYEPPLKEYDSKDVFEEFLKCNIHGYVWNKLVNRSLFIKNDFKWEDGINNWEDQTVSIKLFSKAKSYAYVDKYLYHYRCREGSYIRCLITEKTMKDFMNAIGMMENFLSTEENKKYKDLLNYKKLHVKSKLLMDGTRAMQRKNVSLWPEAFPYIKKSKNLMFRQRIILVTARIIPPLSLSLLFVLAALKIMIRKRYTWKQYLEK